MTLSELLDYAQMGGIGIIVILLGMIRIPKLDFSLWHWLGRKIGNSLNYEVINRVDHLSADLEAHIQLEEEEKARTARQRFLRFNDELLEGKSHTKEHFDEILEDVDIYYEYCGLHPNYENSKAELAVKNIKEVYAERLVKHDFLGSQPVKKKAGKKSSNQNEGDDSWKGN